MIRIKVDSWIKKDLKIKNDSPIKKDSVEDSAFSICSWGRPARNIVVLIIDRQKCKNKVTSNLSYVVKCNIFQNIKVE